MLRYVFSDDGVYVGVGMITGSVAVYIAFSLQVNTLCTVKSVLSGHLKIDKTKVLMENGSSMKVESVAECSPWSILQYF